MKLGSLTMDEHDEGKVTQLFKALCGENPLNALPQEITAPLLPAAFSLVTCSWKGAKSWAQWWTNPTHLSK